ncbi:hypothetical protein [Aequorivita sinensis]|uniref:hypothetical protein n=1 Tax=Aequorivita sinensis TaxID=1382458 RepID=UPI0011202A8D|nr:hypothetical protein [Aequorivita sinensis]
MKELSQVTKNVKSYSQYSYWLNEENGKLIKGRLRGTSYHFPHGNRVFDKNRNIIAQGKARFIYNEHNNLIETYSGDDLISTRTYDANQNLLSITDVSERPLGHNRTFKYDDKNCEVEMSETNHQGELQEKWISEYHYNNIIKEFKVYIKNGATMSLKSHTEFNERGNVISHKDRNGYVTKNTIEYDSLGNELKFIVKDENENISRETTSKYLKDTGKRVFYEDRFFNPDYTYTSLSIFEDNRLIQSITHNTKDDKTTISTYNAKGDILVELKQSKVGLYKKEYKYQYDEYGNMTELRYFENNKPVLILEREVEYFD